MSDRADELQAEYREVDERHRAGRPDPRRALVSYALSSACVVAVAAALLMSARWH